MIAKAQRMSAREVRRVLLDMYHLYPPATIAEMTGRAVGTIRTMASAMGLRSGGMGPDHDPVYDDAEIKFIRESYGSLTAVEIGRHLGRSPQAIMTKAHRLGLGPRRCRPWTAAEDAFICAQYPDHGARYVSAKLGRTIDAIKHRARKLGVRRGEYLHPWREQISRECEAARDRA